MLQCCFVLNLKVSIFFSLDQLKRKTKMSWVVSTCRSSHFWKVIDLLGILSNIELFWTLSRASHAQQLQTPRSSRVLCKIPKRMFGCVGQHRCYQNKWKAKICETGNCISVVCWVASVHHKTLDTINFRWHLQNDLSENFKIFFWVAKETMKIITKQASAWGILTCFLFVPHVATNTINWTTRRHSSLTCDVITRWENHYLHPVEVDLHRYLTFALWPNNGWTTRTADQSVRPGLYRGLDCVTAAESEWQLSCHDVTWYRARNRLVVGG